MNDNPRPFEVGEVVFDSHIAKWVTIASIDDPLSERYYQSNPFRGGDDYTIETRPTGSRYPDFFTYDGKYELDGPRVLFHADEIKDGKLILDVPPMPKVKKSRECEMWIVVLDLAACAPWEAFSTKETATSYGKNHGGLGEPHHIKFTHEWEE